jgi:predicted nucleic acid-binding protein
LKLYVESSTVLAWLFGEKAGDPARKQLAKAEMIFASDLTLVECDRVLIRSLVSKSSSEIEVTDRQALLNRAARSWNRMRVDSYVIERSRRPFPAEPLRTLDALHLATALIARSAVPDLAILSLDQRVRSNAKTLGFSVVP